MDDLCAMPKRVSVSASASNSDESEYIARKTATPAQCAQRGCRQPPSDGANRCPVHQAKARKAVAKSKAKARVANRTAGLCAFCPRKSVSYRCPRCLVKLLSGRSKGVSVQSSGSNRALTPEVARDRVCVDSTGRVRDHGRQRRGTPLPHELDDADFDDAIRDLVRARAARRIIGAVEHQQLPRNERRDAVQEAWIPAGRALRSLLVIRDRNRIPPDEQIDPEPRRAQGGKRK